MAGVTILAPMVPGQQPPGHASIPPAIETAHGQPTIYPTIAATGRLQYHTHQLPQYNQQQQIIAIHPQQPYLQLHSGCYLSNVDQVPTIARLEEATSHFEK